MKKDKGDILAERIESMLEKGPAAYLHNDLEAALADYRRPWTLGRSVNGFTLQDGQEWHRNDFTEDMLPDGCRPLLLGEHEKPEDEVMIDKAWHAYPCGGGASKDDWHRRTRRPLPEVKKPVLTPEQIADGWVEWHGGECPVLGWSKTEIMYRDGEITTLSHPKTNRWMHIDSYGDIIAYRPDPYEALKKAHAEGKVIQHPVDGLAILGTAGYRSWHDCEPDWKLPPDCYRVKPEPVMVPLGPEDVKCGDLLRYIKGHFPSNMGSEWLDFAITARGENEVKAGSIFTYKRLSEDFEISRDGGKTWSRCEKEAK